MKQETFTMDVLRWRPSLKPVQLDEANEEQLKALAVAGAITKDSPYFRTLAHDPAALEARSVLYNGIMYGRVGLSRAEREFATFAVSITNGCVYCTSIHSRRFSELTKDMTLMANFLATQDATQLPPRLQKILWFGRKMSEHPDQLGPADRRELLTAGFNDDEILDLVQSTALFAWANRLMLTLGEPENTKEEVHAH
jgi:uncharacterized peroxidase-related enzyme